MSFVLISFWQNRLTATKSALKAISLNRIGDAFLIAAISLVYLVFKTIDFNILFLLVPFIQSLKYNVFTFDILFLDLISFFLMLAAIGKSAQLGLHGWLPEAMEGPTPVSALIHAAVVH